MWLSCTHLPPLESSIEASLDLSNVEPVEVLVSNIKDATVDRAQGANECAQGNDNPLTPHASLPSPDGDPDKVSPRLSLREKDFVAQLLNDLHRTVQAKINYSDEHARALDCLCGVLKAFKLDYQASCLADGFPYELLKSYAVIIEDRVMADAYHTEGVARSRGVVLCLLGEWLGKAFASLAPSISTKANAFKERHIESVDNLPPAHQLIAELFPLCMRQLLYSWMSPVEEGGPCNTKRQRTEDSTKNVHPYVQLILEFANNTLVTGVAHVLYSSLLHSQWACGALILALFTSTSYADVKLGPIAIAWIIRYYIHTPKSLCYLHLLSIVSCHPTEKQKQI